MRRLSLWMGLGLIGMAFATLSLFSQPATYAQNADPTEQQATVNALVEDRLTATAIQQTDVPITATPFVNPTLTPLPTITLMPTAITVDSGGRDYTANTTVSREAVYDISDDAFEAYQDGWLDHWSNDFEDAEDIFDDLIDDEPEFADAYIAMGINHVLLNDSDDALDNFDIAADLLAQDGGTLIWVVTAAWSDGEIDEAIDAGERMLNLYPYDAFAVANLVSAYIVSGDLQTAADTATAHLTLNPTASIVYELRRDIYEDLDQDALADFDQLILDAYDEDDRGDFDDAIELMEEAIELVEDEDLPVINQSLALWNMARFQLIDGATDDAIESLEIAREITPEFGPTYLLLAIGLQFQFNFDERLDVLNDGIALAPDYPNNYLERALYYTNGSELELAAIDHWQYLQSSNSRTLIWENYDPDDGTVSLPYYMGWQHRLPIELEDGDELTITAEDDTDTDGAEVD
ncbi:MAG: hypothetical protein AAF126_17055, partial [Chloroflexota bacterium]